MSSIPKGEGTLWDAYGTVIGSRKTGFTRLIFLVGKTTVAKCHTIYGKEREIALNKFF